MTGPAAVTDWAAVMGDVAVALLGEPNAALSSERELRYGHRGSLVVHIAGPYAGRFRDHEAGTGGGVLDLIGRERGGARHEAWAWLCAHGFLSEQTVPIRERRPRTVTTHGTDAQETSGKRACARAIWKEALPLRGSLAEAYLHRRGVAVADAHGRCDSTRDFDIRARPIRFSPVWWRACRTVEGDFSAFSVPTCRARTRRRCGRFA